MKTNIFVDITLDDKKNFEESISLCEVFSKNLLKNNNLKISTKPGLVEIADNWLRIYSSNIAFNFNSNTGKVTYEIYKNEYNCADVIEKHFETDCKYIYDNVKFNGAYVVRILITLFEFYFKSGLKGFTDIICKISKNHFDFDIDDEDNKYYFWYRNNVDDNFFDVSSFKSFSDALYKIFKVDNIPLLKDDYLLKKYGKNHLGYQVISAAYNIVDGDI